MMYINAQKVRLMNEINALKHEILTDADPCLIERLEGLLHTYRNKFAN